ncbi:hypothetical protein MY1884_005425 [Beauveria asiatica]
MSVKLQDDLNVAEAAPVADSDAAALELRVVRKLDRYFLSLLWFLFLLAFLDRSNIGCVATDAAINWSALLTCPSNEAMHESPGWTRTCR